MCAAVAICGARASGASCPIPEPISSHDGHLYVTRFIAATPYVGAADAVFYTATKEYDAHIPSLSVTAPGKGSEFRSETLSFLNPASEPLEAVVITYAQKNVSDRCIEHRRIDPVSTPDDEDVKAVFAGLDSATVPIRLLKALGSGLAPSCPKPYTEARIDGHPVQPQYPAIARVTGESGLVMVRLRLNADGSVASASIYKSSGFVSLDRSAIQAASSTHYLPELFRCEPVAGAYIFRAEFRL
jgi:TonB family protein